MLLLLSVKQNKQHRTEFDFVSYKIYQKENTKTQTKKVTETKCKEKSETNIVT